MGSTRDRKVIRSPQLTGETDSTLSNTPKITGFHGFVTTGAPTFDRMVPLPPVNTWELNLTINDSTGVTTEAIQITSNNANEIVDLINAGVLGTAGRILAYVEGTTISIEVPDAGSGYYIQVNQQTTWTYNAAWAIGFMVGATDFTRVYGGERSPTPPGASGALSRILNYPGSSFVNYGTENLDVNINRGLSSVSRNVDKLDASMRSYKAVPISVNIDVSANTWSVGTQTGTVDGAPGPTNLETKSDANGIYAIRMDSLFLDGRARRPFVGDMVAIDAAANYLARREVIAGFYNVVDSDDNEIVVDDTRVSIVAITKGEGTLASPPNWAAASWVDPTDGLNAGTYGWSDEAGTDLIANFTQKEVMAADSTAFGNRVTARIDSIFMKSAVRVTLPDVNGVTGLYDPIDLSSFGVEEGDIIRIAGYTPLTPFNHNGDYYIDKILDDPFENVQNSVILLRPVNPEDRAELNDTPQGAPLPYGSVQFLPGGRFANGAGTGEGAWLYIYPSIPTAITQFKVHMSVDYELGEIPDTVFAAGALRAAEEVDERVQQIIRRMKGPFVEESDNWLLWPYAANIPASHATPAYIGDTQLSLEDLGKRMSLGQVYSGMNRDFGKDVVASKDPANYGYSHGGGGYHINVSGPPVTFDRLFGDNRDSTWATKFSGAVDSQSDRRAGGGPFADGEIDNNLSSILSSATALFTHFDVGRLIYFRSVVGNIAPMRGRLAVITGYHGPDKVEIQGWGGALPFPDAILGATGLEFQVAHPAYLHPFQGKVTEINSRATSRTLYGTAVTAPASRKQSIGTTQYGAVVEEGLPTHFDLNLVPIIFSAAHAAYPTGLPFQDNIGFTLAAVPGETVLTIGSSLWSHEIWGVTFPNALSEGIASTDPLFGFPPTSHPIREGRNWGQHGATLVEITHSTDPTTHGLYMAERLRNGYTQIRIKTLEGKEPGFTGVLTGQLVFHNVADGSNIPYYSPLIGKDNIALAHRYSSPDRTYGERLLDDSDLPLLGAVWAANIGIAKAGFEIVDVSPHLESFTSWASGAAPAYPTIMDAPGREKYGGSVSMGMGTRAGIVGYHQGRIYPDSVDADISKPGFDTAFGLVGAIGSAAHTQGNGDFPDLIHPLAAGVLGISRDGAGAAPFILNHATYPRLPDPAGVFITYPWDMASGVGGVNYSIGPEGVIGIPDLPAGHRGGVVTIAQLTDYEAELRSSGYVLYADSSIVRALDVQRGSAQFHHGELGIHPAINIATGDTFVHWQDTGNIASRFGVNSNLLPLSDVNLYTAAFTSFADTPQMLGGHPYYYVQLGTDDIDTFRNGIPSLGLGPLPQASNYLYAANNFAPADPDFVVHVPTVAAAANGQFGDPNFYTKPPAMAASDYTLIEGTAQNHIYVFSGINRRALFTKNCIGMELVAYDTVDAAWYASTIVRVGDAGDEIWLRTNYANLTFSSVQFAVQAQQWDKVGTRELSVTGPVMTSLVPFFQEYTDDGVPDGIATGDQHYSYPSLGTRQRPWHKFFGTTWEAPNKNAHPNLDGKFRGTRRLTSSALQLGEFKRMSIADQGAPAMFTRCSDALNISDGTGGLFSYPDMMQEKVVVIASNALVYSNTLSNDLDAFVEPGLKTWYALFVEYGTIHTNLTIATLDLQEVVPLNAYIESISVSFYVRITNTDITGTPANRQLTLSAICKSSPPPLTAATYWPIDNFTTAAQSQLVTMEIGNDRDYWVGEHGGGAHSGAPMTITLDAGASYLHLDPDDDSEGNWKFVLAVTSHDAMPTGTANLMPGYAIMITGVEVNYNYDSIGLSNTEDDVTNDATPSTIDGKVVL